MKKTLCTLLLLSMTLTFIPSCTPQSGGDTTDTSAPPDTEPGQQLVYTEEGDTTAENSKPVELESYTYTQDFSSAIKGDDKIWYTNDVSQFKNGVLSSPKGTHFLVSPKQKVVADVCYIEADIKSNISDGSPWVTGFIGLRTNNYSDNAVANAGIWLAFKNNTIGCLTGTWPQVMYVNIKGISFRDFRHVYIEDDMKNNVITVYADSDAGEKTLIATYTIENEKDITLTSPDGQTETTTLGFDLAREGYVNFWAHLNGGYSLDNLKVEFKDKAPEVYEGYDKTLLRDVYSDTWFAVDDLGRATPVNTDGSDVKEKIVGMFYFPWHTSTKVFYENQKLYNHTQIFMDGGYEAVWKSISAGPEGWGHYWDEPYFGYYLSNDEWVIRRHAMMLTQAGVDFIFFDVSNGEPFQGIYMTVLKVYKQMREEGLDTPYVSFQMNQDAELSLKVFENLWENLYSKGKYSDLWMMYEGKPLLLGNLKSADKDAVSHFTVKYSWALKDNLKLDKNPMRWSWMQEYPQTAALDAGGKAEQLSVAAGMLVNMSVGRSYRNGREPKLTVLEDGTKDEFHFQLEDTKYGYFFEEQMSRAYEVDPPVLMLTGWNEWGASPWITSAKGVLIASTYTTDPADPTKKYYFVDNFNAEFSRDLEPAKNSIKDNYYYQTIQYLRTFTGTRPIPFASSKADETKLLKDMSAWAAVFPEYRDTACDTTHRDHNGFGSFIWYKNETGRNDFVTLKAVKGADKVYFYAECADNITSPDGNTNWMNLYINTDADYSTGWYGYDICVGRDAAKIAEGRVSVDKYVDNSFKWESAGEAEVTITGNKLVYAIPASILSISGDFDFKWSDNGTVNGEIMQFMDLGDAAPNDRYNYRYTEKDVQVALSDALKTFLKDGIALQTNKYYMFKNGKSTPVCDVSTLATPKIVDGRLFLPITAFDGLFGIKAEGKTLTVGNSAFTFNDSDEVKRGRDTIKLPFSTFSENGICYVPVEMLCSYTSLSYSMTDDGVISVSLGNAVLSGGIVTEIKNKL